MNNYCGTKHSSWLMLMMNDIASFECNHLALELMYYANY